MCHHHIILKSQIVYPFETLNQMSLYSSRLSSLSQNLQQFIVRQKIKPRKSCSLLIQIFIQSLYNLFQRLNHHVKSLSLSRLETSFHNSGLNLSIHHNLSPQFIHIRVLIALFLHLPYNILRIKYRLQIGPHFLNLKPGLNSIL